MKKCWIVGLLLVFLTGCGSAETFETVADDLYLPVMAQMREVSLEIPDSAAVQVMENDQAQRLYLCENYVLTVQTFESGDLDETVRNLCGFSADALQILQTRDGELKRSDWVWTCAGEGGDQVGRAVVLDDGGYHYCLTAMADAELVGTLEEQWNRIFTSFALS